MSRQIQIRRGTAAEHENFTGAIGEITMDTTNKTLRVHDGETAGGTALAKSSQLPPASADYVIETQLPNAQNNYTWYRKYKSGWVEMGGHIKSKPSGEEMVITFPVPFSDDSYFATKTIEYYESATNWSSYCGAAIYNKTRYGMNFRLKGATSWYACGV